MPISDHKTPTATTPMRITVLRLAIPIMLANVSVPLVGIVDTAVMGRMSDPAYIGATAIGATIFSAVFWLFGFLRMGTGGMVAQSFGAGRHIDTTQTIYRSLLLGVTIGGLIVALQIPIFAISQLAFTTSEKLLSLTGDYFSIRVYSAPATLMLYCVIGGLIGLQRMKSVMLTQIVLNLLNVFLTVVFFSVFNWGIKGVAAASVISEIVTLILGLYLLHRAIPLNFATLSDRTLYEFSRWKKLISLNSNLFIRTLCLIIAFYWMTAASSGLGVQTLAANTLLLHMLHFMAYALDGFAHSVEALGGQAIGLRDKVRFKSSVRASAEWALLFAVLFTLFYASAGSWILGQMTTQTDVILASEQYLLWIVIAPIISVWGFLFDGIFIGATETRTMRNGMLVSLGLFAISTSILVPAYGNHGLWASYYVLMLSRAGTLAAGYPALLNRLNR